MKQYIAFSEIEEEVRALAPPIIYKYRDWGNDFHKSIVTKNTIWFAHPKDLNDPYDIRVPVTFDYSEIDDPLFFERLKYHTEIHFPNINPNSREFRVICDNKLALIKANPQRHFEENYLDLRESDVYDRVGVFSLSESPLLKKMWDYYGAKSKGFCVGFDTVSLVKEINTEFGYVTYSAKLPSFSFIKPLSVSQKNESFTKHPKWGYEQEFRILTFNIKKESERNVSFDQNTIKEIIVGPNISRKNLAEIIQILKTKYNSQVKLFKVQENAAGTGSNKIELQY